jgi:hypothetical protein
MENCLQISDHWVTIISGVFTVFLTIVATWLAWRTYRLTKKDEQKTIAINELQAQTKKLEELYLYQVQPKFTSKPSSSGYIKIINVGGDCYNLEIALQEKEIVEFADPFKKWDRFFSSSSERPFNFHDRLNRHYSFRFEDKFGNRMEQILDTSTQVFSNVKKL